MTSGAGHWFALVAGPSAGRDQTGLGVAFYADTGELAGWKWEGVERAIERGDLPDACAIRSYEPEVPEWHDGMKLVASRLGNAMSVIRWEDGGPTIDWSEDMVDRIFKIVTNSETKEGMSAVEEKG